MVRQALPGLGLDEVALTMRETSGTEGFQQLLKSSSL
jgi:hypothetical protein